MLGRRFLSILYEALALTAFVWAMAFVYSAVEQTLHLAHVRLVFQVYLLVVIGIYFVWQWLRGGQTLAMRTWRLRIERSDGERMSAAQAVGRYLLACAGTIALGVTYWWGFFDRDRAFLHDRLAGTRVVRL